MSLAQTVEEVVGSPQGVIPDDRDLPLFKLVSRVRESERAAWWKAKVVDEELLAQGAPADVVLQLVSLAPDVPAAWISRALEACLVDHPRIQLCHSVALPAEVLATVQPAEPSSLLPPLHFLPLCDKVRAVALVKEWSEGVSLLSWRTKRGASLTLTEISDLLDTTSEALAGLHRRGYAHGALTPDSIALQEWTTPTVPGEPEETVWIPKVVDVGLVRTLAGPGAFPFGAVSLWCAPEAFGADPMTDWRRVDQLALAALLYALWTDQVPFDQVPADATPQEARTLRRRQIEALPPPRGNARARALGVTPGMSAACMRALSADPGERFPSLDAFASALRQAARDAGRARPDESETTGSLKEATSPASHITSKFRAVTKAPPTEPAPAPASAPKIEHDARTDPGRPAIEDPERGPAPPLKAKVELPWEGPDDSSAPDPDSTDTKRRADPDRTTRILSRPAEPEGAYPVHPDAEPEEPELRPEPTNELEIADFEKALGGRPWAFNRLAATFLVLWLATLGWALLRPAPSDAPELKTETAKTLE